MTSPIAPLNEKLARALSLARELELALIICYKMPGTLALENGVKRVIDTLCQILDRAERDGVGSEAENAAVEGCFVVLLDVQEAVEGFLDAEDRKHLGKG